MSQQTAASWQDLMAFAFGILKLSPDIFWSMTPREFNAAAMPYLTPFNQTGRTTLTALMQAFPDQN